MRTSGLLKLQQRMLARASTPRNEAVFAEARQRHVAFAPFDDVAMLIAMMELWSGATATDREAVVKALLLERGRSGHELWSTLLVLAYRPMLTKLRKRVRAPVLGDDELDAMVLLAFLEAVARQAKTCETKAKLSQALKLLTKQLLFRAVARALDLPVDAPFEADNCAERGAPWRVSPAPIEGRTMELVASEKEPCITDAAARAWACFDMSILDEGLARTGIVSGSQRELLRDVALAGSLGDFLHERVGEAATCPNSREYGAVKRRRTRTVAKLKTHLRPWGTSGEWLADVLGDLRDEGSGALSLEHAAA